MKMRAEKFTNKGSYSAEVKRRIQKARERFKDGQAPCKCPRCGFDL